MGGRLYWLPGTEEGTCIWPPKKFCCGIPPGSPFTIPGANANRESVEYYVYTVYVPTSTLYKK